MDYRKLTKELVSDKLQKLEKWLKLERKSDNSQDTVKDRKFVREKHCIALKLHRHKQVRCTDSLFPRGLRTTLAREQTSQFVAQTLRAKNCDRELRPSQGKFEIFLAANCNHLRKTNDALKKECRSEYLRVRAKAQQMNGTAK